MVEEVSHHGEVSERLITLPYESNTANFDEIINIYMLKINLLKRY